MATTITGNAKVLGKNLLLVATNTVVISSGSGGDNIKDNDRASFYISSGSNDSTDETITITFSAAQTFNNIILGQTNFKAFKLEYDNSGWTAFANVFSNNGQSLTGADYNYSADTLTGYAGYYFEFVSVTTTIIKITAKKTLIAGAEKFLYNLVLGLSKGTFIDDIYSEPNSFRDISGGQGQIQILKSNLGTKVISRGSKYRAEGELFELSNAADQTLYYNLVDSGEITFYPCGGKTTYSTRGKRIQDFYVVNFVGDESASYAHGRDKNTGLIASYQLLEI